MQLSIQVKDDSKIVFLLQLLRELDFVEVLSQSSNGPANGTAKPAKKKKRTPEQQAFVDGLRESLEQVELHLQGKIKLRTAREAFAELWPTNPSVKA